MAVYGDFAEAAVDMCPQSEASRLCCHSEPVTDVTGVGIRIPAVGATLAVVRTVNDGVSDSRTGRRGRRPLRTGYR